MHRLLCYLMVLTFGSLSFANAQETVFDTKDPSAFLKQLEKEIKATQVDVYKDFFKDLEKAYEKDALVTAADLNAMASGCNRFTTAKLRFNPFQIQYLQYYLLAKQNKIDPAFIQSWDDVLGEVITHMKKGLTKDLLNYYKFTQAMFAKGAFMDSGAKLWKGSGESMELVYEKEPMVKLTNGSLIIQATGDTSIISNTSGIWYVFAEKFVGDRGTMDWRKAGLDSSSVYCKFNRYVVEVNKAEFRVDTVVFHNAQFLKKDLTGTLTDKVLSKAVGTKNANFPRFDCREKFDFEEFSPGVKLRAGYTQQGARVVGVGSKDEPASLNFYNAQKKRVAAATAANFVIKKGTEITASSAVVKLYMHDDSIYHPGAGFKFNIPDRIIRLDRGGLGVNKVKFYDSYHKLEIGSEVLLWKIDSTQMYFSNVTGSGKTPSNFQSQDFFEPGELEKYTNVADFNPIAVLSLYCERNKVTGMDAEDLAHACNKNYTEETIKGTLYSMMEDGFVFYDENHHWVEMKPKTTLYVKANRKISDYDKINFNSLQPNGANGVLDMNKNTINVNGVDKIIISDSNDVIFFPNESDLQLAKGRDIKFSGLLHGARADILAKEFQFDYEKFRVHIKDGDSLLIHVPIVSKDGFNTPQLKPVRTFICKVNGEFIIDAPKNKSSRVRLWKYPTLKTTEPSFTFYESPKIHNSAYKRDVFYFKLDTFTLDSLLSFDINGIRFPGVFVSGGIMPDMKQTLTLQKDLSLGFHGRTSADGMPVYNGKGAFIGEYDLSNNGLYGDGTISYISSKAQSHGILFMPDSLNARAYQFDQVATAGTVEFPEVHNQSTFIHWEPKNDRLLATMDTSQFKVFGNFAKSTGTLTVTPKCMYGNGILDWKEGSLQSINMKYGKMSITSDTANLVVRELDQIHSAYEAKDLNAKIDFEKRIGDFLMNTAGLPTDFVTHQFSTTMDRFHWDMNSQTVDFKNKTDKDTAWMISKNPAQNGLRFPVVTAQYQLGKNLIQARGVSRINLGDALIMPDSGYVYIEPKAAIRPLNNAKINCDTVNNYHKIYDANVQVISKDQYLATNAKYDFNSKVTGKQVLQVDSLFMRETAGKWSSYGFANIKADQNFALNKKMTFKGYFKFDAKQKDPSLDGFARLKLNTTTIRTDWFSLNSVIRADSGNFNVYQPRNELGSPLYFGIMRGAYDTLGLYPSIFAAAANPLDKIVFRPQGFLQYNPASNEIVYGSSAKLNEQTRRGDYLKFNDANNRLYGEGKFDFGLNLGAPIDLVTVGNVTADLNKNSQIYNLCMGLKLDLPKEMMDVMIKDWVDLTADKNDVDYKAPWIGNALAELLTDRELKKALKNVEEDAENAKLDLPRDFPYTFFLTNVKMGYDPYSNSLKGVGNVGVTTVGGQYFGKLIYAYIEIDLKKAGDNFTILFETSEADWYYFSYANHVLQVLSSNEAFTTPIPKITPEKRTIKDPANPVRYYIYQQSPEVKKRQFKEHLRNYRYQ